MKNFYVVFCPECKRFFAMQEIKSNYKNCSVCGAKVKWKTLHRKHFFSYDKAIEVAVFLNNQKAMSEGMSVKDLLKTLKENEVE